MHSLVCLLRSLLLTKIDKDTKIENLQNGQEKYGGKNLAYVYCWGVRVIGSSKKIAGSNEKNSFYCTVSILITFNCKNVE